MSNTPTPDSILTLVQQMVRALSDKKADDLQVLKVSGKSTITDYLVLATGTSDPHLRALRIEVERVLDEVKHPICGMDVGGYGCGWTVVDAYQIMAHIFTPEQRGNYALERLWKDAEKLNIAKLIDAPKPAKPAAKPVTVAAVKPASKKAVVAKAVEVKAVKKVVTKTAVKKVAKVATVKKVPVTKKAVVAKKVVKKAAVKAVAAVKKPVVAKKAVATKKAVVKTAVVKKAVAKKAVAKKVAVKKVVAKKKAK